MHHHFVRRQALAGRLEHRGLELAFAERITVGTDELLEQGQALLAAVADLHDQGEPDGLEARRPRDRRTCPANLAAADAKTP